MKKYQKVLVLVISVFLLTGCTKFLKDSNNKPIKNNETGQMITENIICRPTNETTIEIYNENNIDLNKLPKCSKFSPIGNYEGLWTSLFVKPLAWVIIKIGLLLKNYGLALIVTCLLIRLILYPFTKKTAMQSELLKKAQPEMQKIEKKYENKTSAEDQNKKAQEMMLVYQKYKVNPVSGCLLAFIQLPLLLAFYEAIQRTPAIFEDKLLGLQLGTTPNVGITSATFYAYTILMLLIAGTTFFSLKMNSTGNMQDPSMKMMPIMMSIMIVVTAIFMPTGLGIYWVTSNLFTIGQNILVKRSKEVNGKA